MNSEYNMRGIPANTLGTFWRFAEPYVKRALDHTSGEVTFQDIRQLCEERAIQLWLISHGTRVVGAITTEIVIYPRRKHCRVITLGGSNLDGWLALADTTLCQWAKEQGCDAIESYVRKGMVGKLALLEWRHKHSIVVKDLSKELPNV